MYDNQYVIGSHIDSHKYDNFVKFIKNKYDKAYISHQKEVDGTISIEFKIKKNIFLLCSDYKYEIIWIDSQYPMDAFDLKQFEYYLKGRTMAKVVSSFNMDKYCALALDINVYDIIPRNWKYIMIDSVKYTPEIMYDAPKGVAIICNGEFGGKEIEFTK